MQHLCGSNTITSIDQRQGKGKELSYFSENALSLKMLSLKKKKKREGEETFGGGTVGEGRMAKSPVRKRISC